MIIKLLWRTLNPSRRTMNWHRKKQDLEKDLHSNKYHQRVVEMKKKAKLRVQEEVEAEELLTELDRLDNESPSS